MLSSIRQVSFIPSRKRKEDDVRMYHRHSYQKSMHLFLCVPCLYIFVAYTFAAHKIQINRTINLEAEKGLSLLRRKVEACSHTLTIFFPFFFPLYLSCPCRASPFHFPRQFIFCLKRWKKLFLVSASKPNILHIIQFNKKWSFFKYKKESVIYRNFFTVNIISVSKLISQSYRNIL